MTFAKKVKLKMKLFFIAMRNFIVEKRNIIHLTSANGKTTVAKSKN